MPSLAGMMDGHIHASRAQSVRNRESHLSRFQPHRGRIRHNSIDFNVRSLCGSRLSAAVNTLLISCAVYCVAGRQDSFMRARRAVHAGYVSIRGHT